MRKYSLLLSVLTGKVYHERVLIQDVAYTKKQKNNKYRISLENVSTGNEHFKLKIVEPFCVS